MGADMGRPEAGQSTPLGDLAQAVGDRNLSVHAFLRTLALCNTVDPVPVTPSGHYGTVVPQLWPSLPTTLLYSAFQ